MSLEFRVTLLQSFTEQIISKSESLEGALCFVSHVDHYWTKYLSCSLIVVLSFCRFVGWRNSPQQPLCLGSPREPAAVAQPALPVCAVTRHRSLWQRQEGSCHFHKPEGKNQQPDLQCHRHRRGSHAFGRPARPRRLLPLQPHAERWGVTGWEPSGAPGAAAERHPDLPGEKPAQAGQAVFGAGGRGLGYEQN